MKENWWKIHLITGFQTHQVKYAYQLQGNLPSNGLIKDYEEYSSNVISYITFIYVSL